MAEINLFRTAEEKREVAAGTAIFGEGDAATEMYGVIEGSIELHRGDDVIEVVGPGGVFGEVALLVDYTRSAAARAAEDCVLAIVTEDEFIRLVNVNAFFSIEVMRLLAERLKRDG